MFGAQYVSMSRSIVRSLGANCVAVVKKWLHFDGPFCAKLMLLSDHGTDDVLSMGLRSDPRSPIVLGVACRMTNFSNIYCKNFHMTATF